jgi:hypothetical protein
MDLTVKGPVIVARQTSNLPPGPAQAQQAARWMAAMQAQGMVIESATVEPNGWWRGVAKSAEQLDPPMLTNNPANILRLIVINNAFACDAQYRGDTAACNELGAAWQGLQAAFAVSCLEHRTTKRAVASAHLKPVNREVRAALRKAGHSAASWVR